MDGPRRTTAKRPFLDPFYPSAKLCNFVTHLGNRNYDAKLFTIEIGSSGYIDSHNVNKFNCILKLLDPKVKYINKTVRNLNFRVKYNAMWREPPLHCI